MADFRFGVPQRADAVPKERPSGYLADGMASRIRESLAMRRTPKKPKTRRAWLYPFAQERAYFVQVREMVRPFLRNYADEVLARWPRWETEWKDDGMRADGSVMENSELFDRFMETQRAAFAGGEGRNFLAGIFGTASRVAEFNDKEWQKFVKVAVGQAFHPAEEWVGPMLDDWAAENFNRVKTLSTAGIARMNTTVSNAVQNGLGYRAVMRELRKTEDISVKQAKLLARDQLGKLNGALNQRKQAEAGVDFYEWQTVGDERVRGNPNGLYPTARPSHFAIDGKICKWDDASVFAEPNAEGPLVWKPRTPAMPKAHPGEEIQCRCAAIPYMEPLFDELLKMEQEAAPVAEPAPAKVRKPRAPRKPKETPAPAPDAPATVEELLEKINAAQYSSSSRHGLALDFTFFEQDTGIDARLMLNSLKAMPDGAEVYMNRLGGGWELKAVKGVNRLVRSFRPVASIGPGPKSWRVTHDYFYLDENLRGGGRAKRALLDQFKAYTKSGRVEGVDIHAALSNGAYTWARFGFVPTRRSWDDLLDNLERHTKSAGDTRAWKFAADLDKDRPKDLWDFADSKYGAKYLPGKHWHGSFEFGDAESVARFYAYTGANISVRSKKK